MGNTLNNMAFNVFLHFSCPAAVTPTLVQIISVTLFRITSTSTIWGYGESLNQNIFSFSLVKGRFVTYKQTGLFLVFSSKNGVQRENNLHTFIPGKLFWWKSWVFLPETYFILPKPYYSIITCIIYIPSYLSSKFLFWCRYSNLVYKFHRHWNLEMWNFLLC